MDILALAATGARYIVNLIANSKTLDAAKEDAIGKSWQWVKQHIFRVHPSLEAQVDKENTNEEKTEVLTRELTNLLQEEKFRDAFAAWLQSLQKDPTVKNFFGTEIQEMEGDIHIGDTGKSGQGEKYDLKNVAMGKVDKMKGNFRVGDDH
ncbi:hypothetical protein [Puia dinghuensis]|uniref:Uncharacterized protein n=1 Tax=Puia dinghuensis TaxID=1792502 RepID=A0A8J2XWX0_9BACT|nr:hypothetical protein [Puia dinghuensis]GGB26381.1 hypothetical protein GCM10011511_57930 [Puia dinghuensis]